MSDGEGASRMRRRALGWAACMALVALTALPSFAKRLEAGRLAVDAKKSHWDNRFTQKGLNADEKRLLELLMEDRAVAKRGEPTRILLRGKWGTMTAIWQDVTNREERVHFARGVVRDILESMETDRSRIATRDVGTTSAGDVIQYTVFSKSGGLELEQGNLVLIPAFGGFGLVYGVPTSQAHFTLLAWLRAWHHTLGAISLDGRPLRLRDPTAPLPDEELDAEDAGAGKKTDAPAAEAPKPAGQNPKRAAPAADVALPSEHLLRRSPVELLPTILLTLVGCLAVAWIHWGITR